MRPRGKLADNGHTVQSSRRSPEPFPVTCELMSVATWGPSVPGFVVISNSVTRARPVTTHIRNIPAKTVRQAELGRAPLLGFINTWDHVESFNSKNAQKQARSEPWYEYNNVFGPFLLSEIFLVCTQHSKRGEMILKHSYIKTLIVQSIQKWT